MNQASIYESEVLPRQEAAHGRWIDKARSVAERLGQSGKGITIDMVRAECPPPIDVDPRVMGSVFQRKVWENCGYIGGYRQASHGRPVAVFKLRGTA